MTDEATREIRAQMRRALDENMILTSRVREFALKDAPKIIVGYGAERYVQHTTRAVVTQRADDTFEIVLHGPRVTSVGTKDASLTVTHEDTNAPLWVLGLLDPPWDAPVTPEEREDLEAKVFDILDEGAAADIAGRVLRDQARLVVEQIVREGWVPWKRG